jgi:hypothetical protein
VLGVTLGVRLGVTLGLGAVLTVFLMLLLPFLNVTLVCRVTTPAAASRAVTVPEASKRTALTGLVVLVVFGAAFRDTVRRKSGRGVDPAPHLFD